MVRPIVISAPQSNNRLAQQLGVGSGGPRGWEPLRHGLRELGSCDVGGGVFESSIVICSIVVCMVARPVMSVMAVMAPASAASAAAAASSAAAAADAASAAGAAATGARWLAE